MAQHLERRLPAGLRQHHPPVGRAFDEPERGELLRHRRGGGRTYTQPRRDRTRGRPAVTRLEIDDRAQVVLDRRRQHPFVAHWFSVVYTRCLGMAKKFNRRKLLAAAAPLAAAPVRQARLRPRRGHLHARPPPHGDAHRAHGDGACGDDRRRGPGRWRPARSRRAPPPAGRPRTSPAVSASTRSQRSTGRSRSHRVCSSRPGLQRNDSRPCDPGHRGRHAPRPLRQRRLASAHDPLPRDPPAGMDGVFEIVYRRRVRLRVPGAARRVPPLPLPRDPAQEAHPQGALRRLHHRSRGAQARRAGARHGHERLRHGRRRREQLLHRQRAHVLLLPLPDPRQPLTARAHLPCEPDGVRPLNSFHLHADFFRYQPTGTGEHWEYTDTVVQCQGQRGVLEIDFAHTGTFMFHAHQSEFAELGWMGFFEVDD